MPWMLGNDGIVKPPKKRLQNLAPGSSASFIDLDPTTQTATIFFRSAMGDSDTPSPMAKKAITAALSEFGADFARDERPGLVAYTLKNYQPVLDRLGEILDPDNNHYLKDVLHAVPEPTDAAPPRTKGRHKRGSSLSADSGGDFFKQFTALRTHEATKQELKDNAEAARTLRVSNPKKVTIDSKLESFTTNLDQEYTSDTESTVERVGTEPVNTGSKKKDKIISRPTPKNG